MYDGWGQFKGVEDPPVVVPQILGWFHVRTRSQDKSTEIGAGRGRLLGTVCSSNLSRFPGHSDTIGNIPH